MEERRQPFFGTNHGSCRPPELPPQAAFHSTYHLLLITYYLRFNNNRKMDPVKGK